jgi:hypothetical protein
VGEGGAIRRVRSSCMSSLSGIERRGKLPYMREVLEKSGSNRFSTSEVPTVGLIPLNTLFLSPILLSPL